MKKWFSLLLCLAMIGSLCACSLSSTDNIASDTAADTDSAVSETAASAPTAETETDNKISASGERRSSGEMSGEMSGELTQEELGPALSEELLVLAAADEVMENSEAGEMTALFELLGETWYVAMGTDGDGFTVNGEPVEAAAVDSEGTLYRWSENAVTGQTVYGTTRVPYADFYYGELNTVEPLTDTVIDTAAAEPELLTEYRSEGMYDAVTSATFSKWKMQSGTYTEANESGSGGRILGLMNFNLAVDADLFINAVILSALDMSYNETLEGLVMGLCLAEETPAVYKTLYADGSLSALVGEESELAASFSVSSRSKYGDYELKAGNVRLSGTVLGVVLTDSSGEKYGLCHLDNIWGSGRELAWYCSETTKGRYLPYTALTDVSITEIRYLTSEGIVVCGDLDLVIG